ncbi:hypothetical protein PR048_010755 [Dryococelus australis]|uniref:Uncharacterized protein n=1 Tax=Dryococelus australis TaxID=614101 RepID=A0ABQ9I3L4_9NEOP|nr:hypothetical protein PR048_010755 [Dryococelus australis]
MLQVGPRHRGSLRGCDLGQVFLVKVTSLFRCSGKECEHQTNKLVRKQCIFVSANYSVARMGRNAKYMWVATMCFWIEQVILRDNLHQPYIQKVNWDRASWSELRGGEQKTGPESSDAAPYILKSGRYSALVGWRFIVNSILVQESQALVDHILIARNQRGTGRELQQGFHRARGEPNTEAAVEQRIPFGEGSVMVWGGITLDTRTELVIICWRNTSDLTASQSSTMSSSGQRRAEEPPQQRSMFSRQGSATQNGEDTEDTMKNLRKTFAGIFGDM